jgi:hypothetical protein
MIMKGTVQCPCCAIMVRAYYQASAESVLCPNCQDEIPTKLVMPVQSLPSTMPKKPNLLATLCGVWLKKRPLLGEETGLTL